MGWGEESLTGLRMASWRLDWCQQRSPHYYALPNLARPVLVGNYGLKLPPAVLRLGSVRRGGSARGVIGGRPQLPPSAGWRPLASGTSHPLPSNPKTHLGEMLVAAREGGDRAHSTSSLPSTTASGARRPCLLVSSARHRDISTTGDEP
jgi:hypothetical protein